jgi:hypothetical protein
MGSPQFIGERIPGDVEDKGIRRQIYIGHLTPRAGVMEIAIYFSEKLILFLFRLYGEE